jgi:hypothetical protein
MSISLPRQSDASVSSDLVSIPAAPITQLPGGKIAVHKDAKMPDGDLIAQIYFLNIPDNPLIEIKLAGNGFVNTPLPTPPSENLIRAGRFFWGADISDPEARGTRIEKINIPSGKEDEGANGNLQRIILGSSAGTGFFFYSDRNVVVTGSLEEDRGKIYYNLNLEQGWKRMIISRSRDEGDIQVQKFTSGDEHPSSI